MAQWDVYANPSPRMREVLPLVVVLQSDLLDSLGTRLIAPLAVPSPQRIGVPHRMCPVLDFQGESYVLVAQESAPIDARALRHPLGSLRDQAHRIVDALDAVISGV
jgi:toxin CcdB